jgi:hypothetical protein
MAGRAQESIASLGAMCCALAPARNRRRGYADCGSGFDIGIGVFKGSLSPNTPRYYCDASTSALGTLATVEAKGSGTANHSKIDMLVVRRSFGGFP